MEPPAKRPRLGIPSYNNNQDEIDGDELNLQPEQVNALRDPGYQLERSRAVAANRLKSAFERIFEKYEKDFTGIGDEINLETGEVEVDNGHIQSLQDAILGDEDEEDGDDSDSMDEEERMLQGKTSNEKRLSCIGTSESSPLKSLVRPLGDPHQWPADQRRISSMFGPPRPPFGSFSTEYEIRGDVDTMIDPTWKTPQLPVVETYVDPAWRAPDLPPPKPATPRLPMLKKKLLTGGTGDEDGEDILSGASTTPLTKLKGPVSVKKIKKPSPSNTQGSDPGSQVTSSKSAPKRKESNTPKPKESTGKKGSTTKKPETSTSVKPHPRSGSNPDKCTHTKEKQHIDTNPEATKQLVAVESKKPSDILPKKRKEPGENPRPEIYIDISSGKAITTKPKDQKLIVDIVVRKKIDTSLYQMIPTDPSSDQPALTQTKGQKEDVSQRLVDVPEDCRLPSREMGAQTQTRESTAQEVYRRNVVDSSFAFSDDEEPALPKPRVSKRRPGRPKKKNSVVQLDASNVPQPQDVAPEHRVSSALKEGVRESEARTEKTDAVADQDISGNVEAPAPVAQEVYTRNNIDSSFTFSDEEESALPRARVKASSSKKRKALAKLALADEPAPADESVPASVEVPLTILTEPNDEETAVPQTSANEQPALDKTTELHNQETAIEDLPVARDSGDTPNERADNQPGVSTAEIDTPLAPVETPASPSVPEANPETNHPPAETDIVQPQIGNPEPNLEDKELPAETATAQQTESTPQLGSSEHVVADPTEIVEPYPVRLLQMKPRRKRKISMAFTEEYIPTPLGPEGDKPTETFITAPSKRLKKPRLSYSVEASDLGGQQEEQTVQLDPEPQTNNDITIPETSPPPPPPPDEIALPDRAPVSVDLTVPESSPLIQPAFKSSLLGIVQDLAQVDDDAAAEPEEHMDFDDTPSHPTPMPDLPSPELGEDVTVPETSPLPYSSPSKAVKAVKKPKRRPPPPLQPSTPVNRKEEQKKQQIQKKEKVSISPLSSSGSKGILSLVPDVDDDDELETDELSLTPRPRYYTPPSVRQNTSQQQETGIKHTSLTAPLLRMKLLSSSKKGIRNNPKTPFQSQGYRRRTLMAPVVNNEHAKPSQTLPSSTSTSRMYFSADRRASTTGGSAGQGVKRRRSGSTAVAVAGGARHNSSAKARIPKFVQPSDEHEQEGTVLTPGGTKRRCGEDGFHCDRDFCFVCL